MSEDMQMAAELIGVCACECVYVDLSRGPQQLAIIFFQHWYVCIRIHVFTYGTICSSALLHR